MTDYGLKDRITIITGATGGIGRALAMEFYTQGAQVVLTGRNHDKLNALTEKLISSNPKAAPKPFTVPLDLTATHAEQTLIDTVTQKFGDRIDILVNNAGMVDGKMVVKTDPTYLQHMMHVNFTVPYNLCKLSLPYMGRNKYGRIINITSIAGTTGDASMSAYAASKGALVSATKSIATEYGRRGFLTANCIAPGIIDTDATKILTAERTNQFKQMIPMHRFGKPEEVAYLAAFLASNRATYINGQVLHIDGGLYR